MRATRGPGRELQDGHSVLIPQPLSSLQAPQAQGAGAMGTWTLSKPPKDGLALLLKNHRPTYLKDLGSTNRKTQAGKGTCRTARRALSSPPSTEAGRVGQGSREKASSPCQNPSVLKTFKGGKLSYFPLPYTSAKGEFSSLPFKTMTSFLNMKSLSITLV